MAWEKFKHAKTDTVLPAYVLIVDELAQFLEDLPREDQRRADQFQGNIQKIARLGRASHIHVILATQSCTGNMFPPSLKNNIAFRNICGRVEANISRTAIDSEEGESIPLSPGAYLGYSKGETQNYQGYFTKTSEVLALGTVKPGYDPKTGLELEEDDDFDLSPIEDTEEDNEEEITPQKSEQDFIQEDAEDTLDLNEINDFLNESNTNVVETSEDEFIIGDIDQEDDIFDFVDEEDIPELEIPSNNNGFDMVTSIDIPEGTPVLKVKDSNGSVIKLNLNKKTNKTPNKTSTNTKNTTIIGATDKPTGNYNNPNKKRPSSGIIIS